MTMCMKCGRRQGGEYKGDPSACACGKGPENPPRLWAFAKSFAHGTHIEVFARASDGAAESERKYQAADVDKDNECSPVAEYVLASTAAAEREAAERRNFDRTTDAIAENVSLRTEAEALRRERDALRVVARRAGDVLAWVAEVLPGNAYVLPGSECITALIEAVDAAQAAKGVG